MTAESTTTAEPVRPGRKRDHSRDPEILEAALDVLAEVGYDRMTVDMVATRAKAGKATLYRRWASKAELVLDAVACLKRPTGVNAPELPDTGTLRGDLVAQVKPKAVTDGARHVKIMGGLVSMLSQEPDLRDSIYAMLLGPRIESWRVFVQRAVERGEIAGGVDIELLASVGPALSLYRSLYLQEPPSREMLIHVIDTVILPAVGLSAPPDDAHQ